ncbi:MAG: 3'-5' exonuclease [Bryobacteraceae bacterium]|nr:3'-5' exonuclease [Bryobacteraceae bacterium]
MDLLAGLNPQQREAVTQTEGPLLILAGAGSGKTRVITHRIAYLIDEKRVPGPAVLAVTFTNKASGEMRDRVAGLLRQGSIGGFGPQISTFHAFCVRLLRQNGANLASIRPGFNTKFTIYDDDDQLATIKRIYRATGLDEKFMQYRAALSRISHAKNQKQTPQDFYKESADPTMARLAVVFEQYEASLMRANALDFDDLLLESVRLLRTDDGTRDAWNRRLHYLMIDEYQDTNRSQYELMRLLSVGHSNVAVVGDEDQSIYSWRGADIRNILDFETDYPNAKVIRLEQNYRSTKNVLAAAGAVVARNKQRKGKNLWTDSSAGEKVGLYEAPDSENEGLWIADTIEKEIAKDSRTRVAVLYRTNSQSRQIEEALRRYNRKYIVVGGFSFYQRAEVKDALCYLKIVQSPLDPVALERIINTPARGIGKSTLDQISDYARKHDLAPWNAIGQMIAGQQFSPRAEGALRAFRDMIEGFQAAAAELGPERLLRQVLDQTGYWKMLEDDPSPDAESRLQNLSELINAAAEASERGENLSEFLDHAALVADSDALDEEAQVSLLTIHNAKGLEFPVVFVAGMEENLFPHSRSRDSETALEEERRLCYVAMTRAEKKLYLSWARYRRRFGTGMPEATIASRFLNEVPASLLEVLRDGAAGAEDVDLYGEQHYAREVAQRNAFTGKTYNSVESVQRFFAQKNVAVPAAAPVPPVPPRVAAPTAKKPGGIRNGSTVEHPKFGRGTVLRKMGDGDDARITVQFERHGLKTLIQKYAGITVKE